MKFAIEKGIEIPGLNSHRKGVVDAIRAMEIGDSVVDPCEGLSKNGILNRQTNWSTQARMLGRKVATRRVDGGGLRVWRIQ